MYGSRLRAVSHYGRLGGNSVIDLEFIKRIFTIRGVQICATFSDHWTDRLGEASPTTQAKGFTLLGHVFTHYILQ